MTEHDHNLLQLMKTAKGQGLVFNRSECAICQSKISFCGTTFMVQGMRPDPAKVKLCKTFLPSKSKTTPVIFRFAREQVTNWEWNPSADQAFNCLKSWVCNILLKTALANYGHTKPLILQTDASEYGLSTALIQSNSPIAFTSKTLTDVLTRYVNIERECLSVCFALKSFILMYMVDTSLYKTITSLWK